MPKLRKRNELIERMEQARDLHKLWLKKQKERKEKGQRLLTHAGNEEWHKEWIKTYNEVIKQLKIIQ